jgi:GNAT superfamily N-acetyltransferase
MTTIHEVHSKRDLKAFIKFPLKLYKNNPYWVPELNQSEMDNLGKNPAFDHCEKKYWLAKKEGKVVGRIAGIINKLENEKTGDAFARFGWLDFEDDPEVSKKLIETVEQWAAENGMTKIHGPLGFTDLDNEGMLIEGFKELGTLAALYNYPYYPEHLEKYGYEKSVDWVEFEIDVPDSVPERIESFAKKVADRYQLRNLEAKRSKDLRPYIRPIFDLINDTYSELYGVVELTEKQIDFYAEQYFGFINANFISVILNAEDEVVGFGITMPSLSTALQKSRGRLFPFGFIHILRAMKKNDRADFYLIGIRKDFQRRGVHILMFDKILKAFHKFGIKKVETNPELENNTQIQAIWKDYHPRQHKRRRCFIKKLA